MKPKYNRGDKVYVTSEKRFKFSGQAVVIKCSHYVHGRFVYDVYLANGYGNSSYAEENLLPAFKTLCEHKEETKMNEVLTGYKKVVGVSFAHNTKSPFTDNSKLYNFALYEDVQDISGRFVVVDTCYGPQVGTVEEVLDPYEVYGSAKPTREVIDVVDLSGYDKRVETREKKAKLKLKMDDMIKSMDEVDKYKRYAEVFPEFAEIFKQYNELG